jgi:hypothetical protein
MDKIFGSLPLSTLSTFSGGALTDAMIQGLVQKVRAAKQKASEASDAGPSQE